MKSESKQRTLATMTGFERYTKKTRRAMFLEEMEQVVPWGKLCALVERHYPKPGNGRRPKELEQMLRIYFLQHWFNLADPAVEEALYDSSTLRQFVGIDLGDGPDFGRRRGSLACRGRTGQRDFPRVAVRDARPRRLGRRKLHRQAADRPRPRESRRRFQLRCRRRLIHRDQR